VSQPRERPFGSALAITMLGVLELRPQGQSHREHKDPGKETLSWQHQVQQGLGKLSTMRRVTVLGSPFCLSGVAFVFA
jgi:hypothetical protein